MDTGRTQQIELDFNPFVLKQSPKISGLSESVSINEIIARNRLTFLRPFLVLVDNDAVSRAEWDNPLHPGCEVKFIELPDGGGSNPFRILALIAIMALSFWLGGIAGAAFGKLAGALVTGLIGLGGSMLVNYFLGAAIPKTEEDAKDEWTAYSLEAGNQLAVGVPVPEHFGRVNFFPPLIQTMYTRYFDTGYMGENNKWVHRYDQFLYMIGVIGVGEYTVHNVLIDKTPISHYENRDTNDVEYAVLGPGTAPTIVPRLCWMSPEANGQELTEEPVKFIVNPLGSIIYTIQVDFIFPGGLCAWDKETGDPYQWNVTLYGKVRRVDDDGAAIEDWTTVLSQTHSAATTTQLAMTTNIAIEPSAYRYEMQLYRSAKQKSDSEIQCVENVNITALKGFGRKHPDYGDATLIEIKLRASNQLSGNAASRIRVVATRKLYPVTATGFDTTLANTTNPVDAAAYIVASENGGKLLQNYPTNTPIDYANLYTLRQQLQTRGDTFNYRFTSRSSVMDACSKVAMCCRSVPFMPGGKFSMVRDTEQTTPVQIYNENDITDGSLTISHKLRTADDPTCVEVQYLDPLTLEVKSIQRYDEDGSDENPWVLNLEGCSNRAQAWREACYLYADNKLNRSTVEFTTGLKGHIPSIGQKILVAMSQIDWAQSGLVAAVDGDAMWVSEPITFGDAGEGQLYLSTPTGGVSGPHTVTPGQATHSIIGTWTGLDIRTIDDDAEEATRWIFGVAISEMLPLRVVRILPQSENEIRIVGSIVNDEVYDADLEPVPDEPSFAGDLIFDVTLTYNGVVDEEYSFTARWSGDADEVRIELDEGSGYTILQDEYASYTLNFSSSSTEGTIKVTPYEDGVLITAQAETESWDFPPPPTNLAWENGPDDTHIFTWDDVSTTANYELNLLVDDEVVFAKNHYATYVGSRSLGPCTVTWQEIRASGGPWMEFDVNVYTVEGAYRSVPATINVLVIGLDTVNNFDLQSRLASGVTLTWDEVDNATGYAIYYSSTQGFDPKTEGTLVYDGWMRTATIGGLDMTGSYEHYFHCAAYNEMITDRTAWNFSSELAVLPESSLEDVTDESSVVVTTATYDNIQIPI